MKHQKLISLFILVLLFITIGCQKKEQIKEPQKVVIEYITAYMDGDFETCKKHITKERNTELTRMNYFSKEKLHQTQESLKNNNGLKDLKITNVELNKEKNEATVTFLSVFGNGKQGEATTSLKLIDNHWKIFK